MTNKEAIELLRKVAMKTPVDCTDIKERENFCPNCGADMRGDAND